MVLLPSPTSLTDWSPSQLAERSGLTVSALHFYERQGLIRAERTSGNQRRYPRETLRRLAFIRAAQRVGIPLADIRTALDTLPQQRTPSAKDWSDLSARWQNQLEARIQLLHQLKDELDRCIGCGCLSVETCTLLNPNDQYNSINPSRSRLDI